MAKFLYHTATGAYEENTKTTIKLALLADKLYKEIATEEGLEFDQTPSGILHFYKDPAYFESAKNAQSIYQSSGVAWDIFGPMQTKALDKTLNDVDGIVGGAWTWHDWTGDIHKFCYQLANVLYTKYNVKFSYNDKIRSSYDLEVLTDCFDAVVIAAGVGSEKLANKVGDNLDIYPVKGYSITINNVDPNYLPQVSLLDDQAKIVTSTLGNRLRVAGTAELAGENYDIRKDRIQPLLDWVHTNFPNINTHDYTQWACLRPMTPNMLPVVRQSTKNKQVFYHAGHGHLGWTLSPATAKQVVELIKNADD
jgi:D-amino-acid dehydrogenase